MEQFQVGNAIMANNLLKLSIIFDIAEWKQKTDDMLNDMLSMIIKYPSSFSVWAVLLLQQTQDFE